MVIMINQFELIKNVEYNSETGIFIRRSTGNICKSLVDGYIRIHIKNKCYRAHRLAWLYYYGEWPSDTIDHINRNKIDNRIVNLRIANQVEQKYNTNISIRNKSGFKGVCWDKKKRKWRASCKSDGKYKHIGFFTNPTQAHNAYVEYAKRTQGEFSPF